MPSCANRDYKEYALTPDKTLSIDNRGYSISVEYPQLRQYGGRAWTAFSIKNRSTDSLCLVVDTYNVFRERGEGVTIIAILPKSRLDALAKGESMRCPTQEDLKGVILSRFTHPELVLGPNESSDYDILPMGARVRVRAY